MAKRSKIEWLKGRDGRPGSTWNPWYGCEEISAGCAHCYARAWAKRCGRRWEVQAARAGTVQAPLHWQEPRRIFVCSLSDFWHPDADCWRAAAWDVILRCPQHTFILLTKRPERILGDPALPGAGIPENCWLGVTVENQVTSARIDQLARVDAPVRFLSCEPLVGHLTLHPWLGAIYPDIWLDWVIVGGESGPGCRPMPLGWVEQLQAQCLGVDVPFYLKQLGGHPDPRSGDKALLGGLLHKAWPDAVA